MSVQNQIDAERFRTATSFNSRADVAVRLDMIERAIQALYAQMDRFTQEINQVINDLIVEVES